MKLGSILAGFFFVIVVAAAQPATPPLNDGEGQQFLQTKCAGCHGDQTRAGGLAISSLRLEQIQSRPDLWTKAAQRVHNGEMPPKAALPVDQREAFVAWVEASLRKAACTGGLVPGPAPIRR